MKPFALPQDAPPSKSIAHFIPCAITADSPQLKLAAQWENADSTDVGRAPALLLPLSVGVSYQFPMPREAALHFMALPRFRGKSSRPNTLSLETSIRSLRSNQKISKILSLQISSEPKDNGCECILDMAPFGGHPVELTFLHQRLDKITIPLPFIVVLNPRVCWAGYTPPSPPASPVIAKNRNPQIASSRKDRPIRTLMFSVNLLAEGAPFSQYEIASGLKDRKALDPVVVSPSDGPLRQFYEKQNIPTLLAKPWDRPPESIAEYETAVNRLADMIHKRHPEVVYANTLEGFHAIEAAFHAGIPSLWNIRESDPWNTYFFHLGPDLSDRALRAFQFPSHVIFVSKASRRIYEPLNTRDNFITIPNGLETKRFRALPAASARAQARHTLGLGKKERMILNVGAVTPRKGQIDLIAAFQTLPLKIAEICRLWLIGDREGSYSRLLHRQISGLPPVLRDRIHVIAETPGVETYYHAADLFVFCSRRESYPRVLLEAMHFSLPIITTPVDGVPEQVSHEGNAFFYPPGDVSTLGARIEELLGNDALRGRFAQNSARHFCSLPTHQDMLNAYRSAFEGTLLAP